MAGAPPAQAQVQHPGLEPGYVPVSCAPCILRNLSLEALNRLGESHAATALMLLAVITLFPGYIDVLPLFVPHLVGQEGSQTLSVDVSDLDMPPDLMQCVPALAGKVCVHIVFNTRKACRILGYRIPATLDVRTLTSLLAGNRQDSQVSISYEPWILSEPQSRGRDPFFASLWTRLTVVINLSPNSPLYRAEGFSGNASVYAKAIGQLLLEVAADPVISDNAVLAGAQPTPLRLGLVATRVGLAHVPLLYVKPRPAPAISPSSAKKPKTEDSTPPVKQESSDVLMG